MTGASGFSACRRSILARTERLSTTAGNDDPVSVGYTHHNALLIRIHRLRLIVVWLVNVQTNFFNESRCHNEKDQHDEDHVQHWR